MDDKRFWDIIGHTCRGPWVVLAPEGEEDSWDEFRWFRPLITELKKLAPGDIVRFQYWFDQKLDALYTWDHWGVMHLLTVSESDNQFAIFRSWLVCMGKRVYEAALANPDTLADILDPTWDHAYTSGFFGPGHNAWAELGGQDAEWDSIYASLGKRAEPQITGVGWPAEVTSAMLIRRYPRLAALFGYVDDSQEDPEEERAREQRFWDIIARACPRDYPKECTWDELWLEPLVSELTMLEPRELTQFSHWRSRKLEALDTDRHLEAGRLLNAGMEDRNDWTLGDGFYGFRYWLVGMGREVYEAVLADPDALADFIDPGMGNYEAADIGLAPERAWRRRGLPEDSFWISESDHYLRDVNLGKTGPSPTREDWDRDDPAEWRKRYPRLAALCGVS